MLNSPSCSFSLSEGAAINMLGDASTGYIVNVVREKSEEAVRIPPSISSKLKAHQVFVLLLTIIASLYKWRHFQCTLIAPSMPIKLGVGYIVS